MTDSKKRKEFKLKENEAIQFTFDLEHDKAEDVVKEMVCWSLVEALLPHCGSDELVHA